MLDLHQSNTETARQPGEPSGGNVMGSLESTGSGSVARGVYPQEWSINSVESDATDFDANG